jgi:3-oxoadipate enol-lactonase
MPIAKISNIELHYELSGPEQAPVLLFSNSLGTTLHMWDAQVAEFSKHFRLLRYDTRGHGQTSVPAGPYTIEQLSADVVHLLDILHLQRVNFCGLSMGGSTGQFLGAHFPERFHKMVLCSTAVKIGTPESWDARISAVQKDGMKVVASAVIERWFTAPYRVSHPAEIATMQSMLENANPAGYASNCAAVRDADLRPSVSLIRLPALVISGAHDPATTPADGRSLAQQIPNARYAELSAAHISNIEAQAAFNQEVLSFLLSSGS